MGSYLKACKWGKERKFNFRHNPESGRLEEPNNKCFTFYVPTGKEKDGCTKITVKFADDFNSALQRLADICERLGFNKVFIEENRLNDLIAGNVVCEENFCYTNTVSGSKILNTFAIKYAVTKSDPHFAERIKYFRDCTCPWLCENSAFRDDEIGEDEVRCDR